MDMKNLVILGGGFAGATLARAVQAKLPKDWAVTLCAAENYITYNPLLPEVVGASIMPGHVVAPIRQVAPKARLRMVNVTGIDPEARELHYLGEGSGVIHYDQLVIACGTRANLDLVPGMARYALPLKTLGDALFLRNRIIVRLEQAELQDNPELRRWLTTFVIIGAGFSGVELAGEIDDFLHAALQSGERIMPELSPKLSAFALKKMCRRGIDVRLNTRAVRIDDQGLMLDDGSKLNGGTVICTIGTAPSPLIDALPAAKQRGRLTVAPDMSLPDHPEIWAIGDCAAVINAHDGKTSPPTAQFAVRQARQVADNIARRLRGLPTRAFRYRPQGQLSSIGHNKAVAEVFGIRVSGFPAWLLWRGVYLLKIPTLARKVRVFMEWNWGMLFPPDIVHLRFTQTRRGTSPLKIQTAPEPAIDTSVMADEMQRPAALPSMNTAADIAPVH
jgi:NADH dehydrogenase